MHRRVWLTGLILCFVGGWGILRSLWAADAAALGALLDAAQQAIVQRDYARALDALETAVSQVRLAAPLTVAPALLVTEPATFYGGYTLRSGRVFERGELLHFYLEPKNLV